MKEYPFETATLSNGLRIIHQSSPTDVVYMGYAIDAGTRDEAPGEHGLAHFVEHTLFKGTARRRAWHILNRMENVGGDLNAYTGKEETVVYAALLKHDFARALDLLTDIVFHCTFPEAEISKERAVILDEIDSYADSPSELILDDFEDLLFSGHPLGHNILGTPRSVRRFDAADARRFTARHYCPARAVLFVYGNIPLPRIERLAAQLTSDLPSGTPLAGRTAPSNAQPRTEHRHRHTHQTLVATGTTAYPHADPRRIGLALLSNLLGGPGMNSRLNVALRERLGLVYNVEANISTYTDTSTFSVCYGCAPADAERCMALTHAELQRLIDAPLSSRQLAAARRQLMGQIGVAADIFENNALAMGKACLHYGRPTTRAELLQRLDALTPDALQAIAADILAPNRFSTLIYT